MVKVQQRGLGKGLSALISETNDGDVAVAEKPAAAAPAKSNDNTTPHELPTDELVPGKYQPRHRFSDEQLAELTESVKKNGIMQPILVRPVKRSGRMTYEIIAGERRWRAANQANLKRVPVIIRDISDQQALELAIIENVQRADLTPLEEANGYQRLIEEFSYTQEELAKTVGKSRSHIANLLRLLSLPEDIRDLLEEGKLSMGHARALLNADNASEIAKTIVDKGLSVRQAESLARGGAATRKTRSGGGSPKADQFIKMSADKDPDIIALEESLSENLGISVIINNRGQDGEVILRYDSLAQLDTVLQKLGGGSF